MPATSVQQLSHQLVTQPPPMRGLNTTGAIANMAATDALQMDNFIATDLGLAIREGWREYATGLGAEVRTIMSYDGTPAGAMSSPLAASVLFAATDDGIYDVEGGGDMLGEAPMIALSGGSYAGRFSFIHFTTDAGQFLVACSETDGGFIFDGAAWTKMIQRTTGSPGVGVIDGVDPTTFVQVCAFKSRLLFVQRNSTVAWILPVGSVGGAALPFDFGPLLRMGGMLLALVNWTQDAGAGIDDRLVVLGSSGDLVVYEGTDPTNADAFSCVGTWFIGRPPVGRRCFTTAGGNIFVLTAFGVIPVAQVVSGGLDNILTSDTEYIQQLRRIQTALNVDFASLLDTVGWEIMYVPHRALLHIARPSLVSNEFVQYAFQQHNLAWGRLLDVPAVTFWRQLDRFYAGTEDGRVLRVLDGHSDGMLLDGTGAQEIRARVTPAFNYFTDPTVLKQALMVRVNFVGEGEPAYVIWVNADFALHDGSGAPIAVPPAGAIWDEALWDQDVWSGGQQAYGQWRSAEGLGYALTPTVYVASEQACSIANIEYMVKAGGPL